MARTLRIARYILIAMLTVYWPSIAVGTHLAEQQAWIEATGDKLAHFGCYAGLAFLLNWCVMYRQPSVRWSVMVLAIVFSYGFVDEMTQMLVPTRRADLNDWIADCLGAIVGSAVYFLSLRVLDFLAPPGRREWSSNSQPAISKHG